MEESEKIIRELFNIVLYTTVAGVIVLIGALLCGAFK